MFINILALSIKLMQLISQFW